MWLKYVKLAWMMAFWLPVSALARQQTGENVRFLALGDSYTIGHSLPEAERWPVQLIDSLRAAGISCDAPRIVATTGWRTDNLSAALKAQHLPHTYNLVSVLIGVNDYYQNKPVDRYLPEFETLLETAIALAGGDTKRVFVVSIPDYGYTPFGNSNQQTISKGIDAFNAANRSVAGRKGILYINITDISRQGLARPELVAADGLHPSRTMYAEWVHRILDSLRSANVFYTAR